MSKVSYHASGHYTSEVWTWAIPMPGGASRSVTLLVVLAMHLAILALLLTESQSKVISAATEQPVELLYLPPAKIPKVRSESAPPRRISTDVTISNTLPGFDSPSPASPSSGSEGNGAAVDWAAEARRAIQAFEIRHDHPSGNEVLGSSPWNDWWRGGHRAGDRYRTDSGDWIVWISSSCYQVAKSTPSGIVSSSPPQTICPCRSDSSSGAAADALPVCKQANPRG